MSECPRTHLSHVTRRKLITASAVSIAALSGCLAPDYPNTVSLQSKSVYFESVEIENPAIVSEYLSITVKKERPDDMDYALLLIDGQQDDVAAPATAETKIKLWPSDGFYKDTEMQLAAVSGGRTDGVGSVMTHVGGDVLETVLIQEKWP